MATDQQPVHSSDIKITVSLNQERHPVSIRWDADDAGLEKARDAKAMLLALWDKPEKSSMRIDLWTNEMSVEEMQFFYYESLASMADTLMRATGNKELANDLRTFAREFGKKAGVLR